MRAFIEAWKCIKRTDISFSQSQFSSLKFVMERVQKSHAKELKAYNRAIDKSKNRVLVETSSDSDSDSFEDFHVGEFIKHRRNYDSDGDAGDGGAGGSGARAGRAGFVSFMTDELNAFNK